MFKMAFPKRLRELCTPALIYFLLSAVGIIVSAIQNMGSRYRYFFGPYSCRVFSCLFVFVVKVIYILFWTWLLNLMCKDGHSEIAWFLVVFPFVLLFVAVLLVMEQANEDIKHTA